MPKYLMEHLEEIKKKITTVPQILLFLDYDGTLVPFKNTPQHVTTPSTIRKILHNLIKHSSLTLVIITGRTETDIQQRIKTPGVIICAIHGIYIKYPSNKKFIWSHAQQTKSLIQKIKKQAHQEFDKQAGIYIEDKKYTLAIHYRLASNTTAMRIKTSLTHIVRAIDQNHQLELLQGAKVLEIRPKGWHKGKAVEKILNTLSIQNKCLLPVYMGDDTTDEDAFNYLRYKGITIHVSNNTTKKTLASYFLKNPQEVAQILELMHTILNG